MCKIKTAVFGGTFNPIHNGHIAIAECIMQSGLVDELWLLVTPCNPWKEGKALMPDELRLKMASDAVAHIPGAKASDFEFTLPIPSFSVNTLKALKESYPDREFILVIGADNWCHFHKWKDYEYILENHRIMVYPRTGSPIPDKTTNGVIIIDSPQIDISSTMILNRLKDGLPVEDYVPLNVLEELQRMPKCPPSCQ